MREKRHVTFFLYGSADGKGKFFHLCQKCSFPVTNILIFNGTGFSWTATAVPLNGEPSLIRLDDERTIFLRAILIQTAMILRLFTCVHTVTASVSNAKARLWQGLRGDHAVVNPALFDKSEFTQVERTRR
jgi:hypothetical protein